MKRELTLPGQLQKIGDYIGSTIPEETIPEIGGGLWVEEVYVGTANYGVYYTSDFVADPRYIDGVPTWVTVNVGINPADGLIGLRGDPWEPGNRQYVLMTTGIYSRTAGGNWVSILTLAQAEALAGSPVGPNAFGLDTLETSINRRGHVAVILNALGAGPTWASFYIVSYDYGATWTAYNMIGWGVNGMSCQNLTIGAYKGTSPYDAGQVMYTIGRATANTAIFVSLDGGQTWAAGSVIGGSVYYCDVLVDPNDQSRVYIGLRDGVGPWHVAVSEDHGATWTDIDAGAIDTSMGAQQIWYMLSKAMDERGTVRVGHVTVFAPTFHMTRDEGISWDEPTPEYATRTFGVSLVQDAPDYLYLLLTSSPAVGTPHVIYASTDECRDMVPKAGANANIAVTGGGDSIPYDCGGIRGILQVWTTPNRHGVNSAEHDGTLDGMPGLLSTPQTPVAHDLLSAYHGDTLAAAVSRGSIIYGNSTPAWAELVVGSQYDVLQTDGVDAFWGALRNISVNDANPGLTITQAGAGASLSLPSATTAAKGLILGGDVAIFRSAVHLLELDAGDRLIIDFGDFGGGSYLRFRNIGNFLDAGIYEANNDVLYIQAGDADSIIFRDDAGANMMTLDTGAGQLALPTAGVAAGLLLGGDALWYRSAADVMRTPDDVYVEGDLDVEGGFVGTTISLTVTGAVTFSGLRTDGMAYFDLYNSQGGAGIDIGAFRFRAYNDTPAFVSYAFVMAVANDDTTGSEDGTLEFRTRRGGVGPSAKMYIDDNVRPDGNKAIDLGLSGNAWDDCWADDFQNEPDLFWLDRIDDLAIICGIRPSGEIDPRTGLPLIDDDSLPLWIFTKDKETGETAYGPDGKPWLSLKMQTSLSWGAIRQLAARMEALEARAG